MAPRSKSHAASAPARSHPGARTLESQRVAVSPGSAARAEDPAPAAVSSLRLAVAVLAAEAAALLVAGVVLVIFLLAGHPHDRVSAWMLAGFALGGAVLLGWSARGLRRAAGWARSIGVLTQLLLLPLGGNALSAHAWGVGVPMLVAGLVGLAALFAPTTTRVFNRG